MGNAFFPLIFPNSSFYLLTTNNKFATIVLLFIEKINKNQQKDGL